MGNGEGRGRIVGLGKPDRENGQGFPSVVKDDSELFDFAFLVV